MTPAADTPPAVVVPVDLDATFDVGGKLHGGYLLGVVVRAAAGVLDQAPAPAPAGPQARAPQAALTAPTALVPVAASALFVGPPVGGPAAVRCTVLRAGRSVVSLACRLVQDGRDCVEVLLSGARLPEPDGAPGDRWVSPRAHPPAVPAVADCASGLGPAVPGFLRHVELRLDPARAQWAVGRPQFDGDYHGWVRLQEGWDPLHALFVLADAAPPVTFDLDDFGWVPTLQLQVAVRRRPRPGWLQLRQSGTLLSGGLLDEDCTLWDSTGSLVAQARQVAAVRG